MARLKKAQEKVERRNVRQREREERIAAGLPPDEDPDIAGIVPGPQPPLEE
ncbi:MAG TPA: hypothetical protein VHJ20_07120 [Polyangia bacterium]|nr:hypothetical protein [Polyangia bacterium]